MYTVGCTPSIHDAREFNLQRSASVHSVQHTHLIHAGVRRGLHPQHACRGVLQASAEAKEGVGGGGPHDAEVAEKKGKI